MSSHAELYCKGSELSVCLKISLSVFYNRRKSKASQFQILCLLWVHPGKEMHCFNGQLSFEFQTNVLQLSLGKNLYLSSKLTILSIYYEEENQKML